MTIFLHPDSILPKEAVRVDLRKGEHRGDFLREAHKDTLHMGERDSRADRAGLRRAADMAQGNKGRREQAPADRVAELTLEPVVSRGLILRQDLYRRGRPHRQTLLQTRLQWLRLDRQLSTTALE